MSDDRAYSLPSVPSQQSGTWDDIRCASALIFPLDFLLFLSGASMHSTNRHLLHGCQPASDDQPGVKVQMPSLKSPVLLHVP